MAGLRLGGGPVLDRLAELHDHHRARPAARVRVLHLLPEVDRLRPRRRFGQGLIG